MADDQDSVSVGDARGREANASPSPPMRPLATSRAETAGGGGYNNNGNINGTQLATRPLILITGSPSSLTRYPAVREDARHQKQPCLVQADRQRPGGDERELERSDAEEEPKEAEEDELGEGLEEQVEEVDGISYRIVAAVTKPPKQRDVRQQRPRSSPSDSKMAGGQAKGASSSAGGTVQRRINSVRRKSSAFVSNLLQSGFLGPQSASSHELGADGLGPRPRRLSIYEMTKSPPPETSLEMYLSDRRRSSTISARQVQQQLEQQSTFETNYCQRQQYFKDLNQKLINQDKKLLNVVANRGQIHRHSVDIAQLPLHSAQAQAAASRNLAAGAAPATAAGASAAPIADDQDKSKKSPRQPAAGTINQWPATRARPPPDGRPEGAAGELDGSARQLHARRPSASRRLSSARRSLFDHRGSSTSRSYRKSRLIIRKFQKLDPSELSSTPAPDVKIGQRVAYKEYYGNEFGTIRWIGRVPQICPDWTVGVEFDNAIGEGDGSLNGRRYFIAKDCFAKFLPLRDVNLVDQHIGRPEPGTMISVMSAAVRPGQMISIQRVSTVHVQHCFMNAPHRMLGADILAVNTRLHCQCPNCGPCAHVIKPPRTQRLARGGKNATHMCQFSTYTCCGMESQEETMCAYTGNKVVSSLSDLPPVGNSWIEGAGYLSNLQAQQSKSMPEEYRLGAAPEDIVAGNLDLLRRPSRSSSRRGSGKKNSRKRDLSQQADLGLVDQQTSLDHSLENNPGQSDQDTKCQLPLVDPLFAKTDEQWSSPCSPTPDPYQYALACPDKVAPEDRGWTESGSKDLIKSPKVVYRDSIENRYLFPTDDLIDSTLEADLENLSQARYGHNNSRNHGSRKLLKSLRSLVSCLSAHSNHSDSGRHSENTVEILDYGAKGKANKSAPERVPSNSGQLNSLVISEKENFDHYSSNSILPIDAQKQSNLPESVSRRHISSSTDCGFSSASQNSINYQSYPACSPVLSLDEDRRTKQIYQRIVARLLASTSVTNEELQRLKKVLFEPHYDSCCLHNSLNKASVGAFSTTESDQIIADIIKKSILYKDKGYENVQTAPCCQQQTANYCVSGSSFEIDKREEQHYAISERYHKIIGNAINGMNLAHTSQPQAEFSQIASKSTPRSLIDSCSTHGSVTLSSCDSFSANAANSEGHQSNISGKDRKKKEKVKVEEKSVDNTNLPQAFELKLTLSINSDKKSQGSAEEPYELTDCSAVELGSEDPVKHPTFNINIVSNGKKDPSENLKRATDSISPIGTGP